MATITRGGSRLSRGPISARIIGLNAVIELGDIEVSLSPSEAWALAEILDRTPGPVRREIGTARFRVGGKGVKF